MMIQEFAGLKESQSSGVVNREIEEIRFGSNMICVQVKAAEFVPNCHNTLREKPESTTESTSEEMEECWE
jgi:hypothetical protein